MPFTIPGPKQRTHLVGDVVRSDAPVYAGLDTMKQNGWLRVKAEQPAARAWGVEWCRLSATGATHAKQAAVLALGRPGQDVVITRTLHRSPLLGFGPRKTRPSARESVRVRTDSKTHGFGARFADVQERRSRSVMIVGGGCRAISA